MINPKPSGEERKTMGGNEMSAEELQTDVMGIDRDARWNEIQAIAKAVAMKDEPPTEIESALCGAVTRAQEWQAHLAQAKAELSALSRASGEAVAWRIETKMKSGAILTEVTDIPEHQVSARKMGCTIIPLFAAPTAPGMCLDEITSEMENAGMKEAKYQYNLPVTRASVCAIFKAMLSAAAKGRAAT